MRRQPDLFRTVRRPEGGEFFAKNGLLFLPFEELQRVIDHVRDVPYVRAVINHVRVRTDPLPPIPETPPTIAAPVPAPNGLPKYTPPASGRQKPAQQATR